MKLILMTCLHDFYFLKFDFLDGLWYYWSADSVERNVMAQRVIIQHSETGALMTLSLSKWISPPNYEADLKIRAFYLISFCEEGLGLLISEFLGFIVFHLSL